MVQINGTYLHYKNENFVEFLVHKGVPKEKAENLCEAATTLKVKIDGKKLTMISDCAIPCTTKFILDEEIDEKIPGKENVFVKSKATLSGNTVTITSHCTIYNEQKTTRIFTFSNTELLVTVECSNPEAPIAKRYYKRV